MKSNKPWQLAPGERGIPYSVSEARGAANNHKNMDEYHRHLMLWLCDKVEELEGKFEDLECHANVLEKKMIESDNMEMLNEPLTTSEGFLNPACINELNSAIFSMPKTYDRLSNDEEWTKKMWFFVHDITGYLAMWAIRQSPYSCPEKLEEVVKYLDACLNQHIKTLKKEDQSFPHMMRLTLCQVNKLLYEILYEQGVEAFDNWNRCKKGKTPNISFASRYDNEPDPDYEFIDLDALLINVCVSLRDEFRKNDAFDKKFKEEYGSLPWEEKT